MLDGKVSFFFLKDCLKYNLKTCFALNADSPYGLFHLPPNPLEKQYRGCVTKTNVCGDGCNPNNDTELNTAICFNKLPMQWRLNEDEIILIVGTSPPNCTYWSITPYLMSSYYEFNTIKQTANFTSVAQKMSVSCPEGPARCAKFASLYQPLNIMKFNTDGEIKFNMPFAALMSSNREISEELSDFIYSNFKVQTYKFKLSTDNLNMGVQDDYKDMYTMLMRIAYPSDEKEMQSYYNYPPVSVFRITPKLQNISLNINTYKNNDTYFISRINGFKEGNNNNITYDLLLSGLEELKQNIIDSYINNSSIFNSIYTSNFLQPFFINGINCINESTECNGDTPDTLYPISENIYISQFCVKFPLLKICIAITIVLPIISILLILLLRKKIKRSLLIVLSIIIIAYIIIASIITNYIWINICHSGIGSSLDLYEKDTYVIYGINHEKTNWSRYSSITAYHFEKLAGLHSASSRKEYINSAKIYMDKQNPLVDYYFVYKYSRNCTYSKLNSEDIYCYDVPYEGVGSIPDDGNIFFIERMYVNPNTLTGPIFEESISARMIHFR